MNLKEVILNHLDVCTTTRSGKPVHTFNIQKFIISEYCSNEHLHKILNIPIENSVFDGESFCNNADIVSYLFTIPLSDVITSNLDDVILRINENITNGNIEVDRDLNAGRYSVLNFHNSHLMDISNVMYLISYMPWHINENIEKVEEIKKAIIDISYHTKDIEVSYDEIELYLELGDEYPYHHFSRRIEYIHNNIVSSGCFLDELIEKTFHNFITDDIAASKNLGNHPVYKGEFSTIVFVGNDYYVRYYLTNKNGFRDLLQLCLAKNYLIMEPYGDYRMFVYLNDSIDKLDEINQLDNLLIGMLKSTNRL